MLAFCIAYYCIWYCVLHFLMNCVLCIAFCDLHSVHCVLCSPFCEFCLCIAFRALHSVHCILCIVFYMHCVLYALRSSLGQPRADQKYGDHKLLPKLGFFPHDLLLNTKDWRGFILKQMHVSCLVNFFSPPPPCWEFSPNLT